MKPYYIAMSAGHGLHTPGRRIPRELDPKETREWQLNSRVCEKIEQLLMGYTGYALLRVDDPTGERDIPLAERTAAANAWGATEYYSVHHNALTGRPWSGSGIEIYIHPNASAASREMQEQLYDSLIDATGLAGNRSQPVRTANFVELRKTNMPAVLMELGYMDSRLDAAVILTEAYADKCAEAIVAVMVKRGGLQKQPASVGPGAVACAAEKPQSGPAASVSGVYKTTGAANLRNGAGVKANRCGPDKTILTTVRKGTKVRCYGYYTSVSGVKWLYVVCTYNGVKYTGFVSSKKLTAV